MLAPDRRSFILGVLAALGARGTAAAPAQAAALAFGPSRPFSFDTLIDAARRAASAPHEPPVIPSPSVLDRIDYDAHWRIKFREEASLAPNGGKTPVQFFHLGRYARDPVAIHLIADGAARAVRYSEDLFDMPADSPAHALGEDAGFAGFRVMRPDAGPDWLSFLGASYFRCDGPDGQYGLSARGLAIDTGLAAPEEFPRFSAFWIGPAERAGEDLAVYARLDSPRVTGAYRFGARRDAGFGQSCTVESRLFFRETVERLGVAPMTSMFWYSETNRGGAPDWRPEVHDSDGLAIETGAGERLWRPLRNPYRTTTSSFFDSGPRGFGLIQRDRDFAHYQDDGVFYNRRPSVWVTPLGDWGRGAVQLVEIPTDDEIFDNIVAYWTPATMPGAGAALSFDYRLDWRARDPGAENLGRVVATWRGWGGAPGQPRPEGVYKYLVDFAGGALDGMTDGVDFDLSAQGGEVSGARAYRIVGQTGWRLMFDLAGSRERPVELRAYLHDKSGALSETWTMLADMGPA